MSYDIKFKRGPLAGTRLEIARSKAATKLPNGTPMQLFDQELTMNATQALAALGELDVHARQVYVDEVNKMPYEFVGPTIAQQWRSEYQAYRTQRGWRARYYIGDPVSLYDEEDY